MKTTLSTLLLILLNLTTGCGQVNQVLNGKLIDKRTGDPIPNATVSIVGVDKDITTSDGEFVLDLSGYYQAGKTTRIFIHDASYGSHSVTYTFETALSMLIIEMPDDGTITVTGIVKDKQTDKLLDNIKVNPVSKYFTRNFTAPEVTTENGGQFLFYLNKGDFTKNIDFIDLLLTDSNGVYKDKRSTVEITSVISIDLEKEDAVESRDQTELRPGNRASQFAGICGLSWPQLKELYESLENLSQARAFKYALNNCLGSDLADGKEAIYFAIQSSPTPQEIQQCRLDFSEKGNQSRCLLQTARQRLRFEMADHHFWNNSIADDVKRVATDSNGLIDTRVNLSAVYVSPGAQPYGLGRDPFYSDDGIPVYVMMFKKLN